MIKLGGPRHTTARPSRTQSSQIKVRVVEKPKSRSKAETPQEPPKRILETPQVATQPPKNADYAGNVNHTAQKETRINNQLKREKAADAGAKGKPDAAKTPAQVTQNQATPRPAGPPPQPVEAPQVKPQAGNLAVGSFRPKPRNAYEALLPSSPADLAGQIKAGFQDYIDDHITEGDRIDINTSEYRYIGYFTTMRKAIELVWNYPLDAARKGEQGEVGLEFIITKDGHVSQVRLLRSSGFVVLDQAIIHAIQAASPFSPLPDGIGKNRLVVTGSFRYVLNGW